MCNVNIKAMKEYANCIRNDLDKPVVTGTSDLIFHVKALLGIIDKADKGSTVHDKDPCKDCESRYLHHARHLGHCQKGVLCTRHPPPKDLYNYYPSPY